MDYDIEKVDVLPNRIRQTSGVYESLIEDISKRVDGVYILKVGKNKPQTVYQQVYKRIRGRKDLKLHHIANKVYIVVVKSATNKLGKPIHTEITLLKEIPEQKEEHLTKKVKH